MIGGYCSVQVPGLNVNQGPGDATDILCLMNMITPEELEDEEEYDGKKCNLSVNELNCVLTSKFYF